MATFTIQIPNDDLADTVAAFSEGWSVDLGGTRQEYAKQQLRTYIRSMVKNHRERQAVVVEPSIEVE